MLNKITDWFEKNPNAVIIVLYAIAIVGFVAYELSYVRLAYCLAAATSLLLIIAMYIAVLLKILFSNTKKINKGDNTMNPNHKNPNPSPFKEEPAVPTYDVETVITAEISLIERDVELDPSFKAEIFKEQVAEHYKKSLHAVSSEFLKDPDIKVQVFLHEKSEKTPENA